MAGFNVSGMAQALVMKILLVSNSSWNLFNFRQGFMNALKGNGADVYFCSPYDAFADKLTGLGFKFIPVDIDRKGTNVFKDLVLIKRLYNIYKREKPHIIFHYTIKPNIYGSIAARLSGVECINTVSGLGFTFIREPFYYPLVKILYFLACNIAKKTFFHNPDDMEFFIKNRIIQVKNAVFVNGSGVNTKFFIPDKEKEGGEDKNLKFLFLGRILWDKGIQELVDAARVVKPVYPAVTFSFLGAIDIKNPTAIPEAKIEEWQKEGLIEYLGKTADVRPYIAESDCVLLPSYREGNPRALLEAASMGKPLIATDVAGCRAVIDDGVNGFLIPPKDSVRLAAAIIKMIELPYSQRKELGEAGRRKMLKEFDEKAVIEQYLKEIPF